jgi:DNA-binding NtrC family response regulator
MRQVRALLARVAKSDATVLIRGESGTGKEVAARTIHRLSARAKRDMVTVNCPALPEQILESELFGYRRGAFTGADQDKEGLFLRAEGSTILLDEIADVPVSVQTKLLRVLQEKEIQPLGQTGTRRVDVRVLASTNQDLAAKIRQGEFREDLYYRLNVITVTMPPLREIREDIPILARHFLTLYAKRHGREDLSLSPEAIQCLLQRPWKGNVRELENAINRAVILAQGPRITPADLIEADDDPMPMVSDLPCSLQLPYREAKDLLVRRFSVAYLRAMLERCRGNVSAAARQSGMERQAMQRLMRRYGVQADEFRKK